MGGPAPSGTSPGTCHSPFGIGAAVGVLRAQSMTLLRGRVAIVASLVVMCALAWVYLIRLAAAMPSMAPGHPALNMVRPATMSWGAEDVVAMFVMWSVMMVAMMLPSATPMILLHDKVTRKRRLRGRSGGSNALFVSGYLMTWVGFSAVATLVNGGLHTTGLLTSMAGRLTPVLAGMALLVAGVYQWSSLKYVCLTHCRSPVGFLMAHWHEGRWGAVRMGIHHGVYCVGCCWLLMVLLFVLGVMNLLWIAVLTAIVLVEKVASRGQLVSRMTGLVFVGWGGWVIASVW